MVFISLMTEFVTIVNITCHLISLELELIDAIKYNPESINIDNLKNFIKIFVESELCTNKFEYNHINNVDDAIECLQFNFDYYKKVNHDLTITSLDNCKKELFSLQDYIDENRSKMKDAKLCKECNLLKDSYNLIKDYETLIQKE